MDKVTTEYFGIQRKIVANVTTDSWRDIPHISYIHEADVGGLMEVCKKINANRSPENKNNLQHSNAQGRC